MTVLVAGARGDVGGAVLAGLAAAGEPVRASSRAPRPGEFPSGVEVARLDLADPASWPAALAGVGKVFLYAHPEGAPPWAPPPAGSWPGRRAAPPGWRPAGWPSSAMTRRRPAAGTGRLPAAGTGRLSRRVSLWGAAHRRVAASTDK